MTAFLLSFATFFSTFAGGLCALRLRDRLHWVLGFAAGVLLGVVAFELLPESFALSQQRGGDGRATLLALVAGVVLLHLLDRGVLARSGHAGTRAARTDPRLGVFSALVLILHSFMDGVAIGLAFQVSEGVGLAAAVAVIAHDFCDGMNTVSVMLVHRNTRARALRMLALDAVAPVLGALAAVVVPVPDDWLAICPGLFAGFLFYIGVTDILPRAYARAGMAAATGLTGLAVLGASFIYVVLRVAGG
jgi:zinc transporter ZupT